MKYFFLPFLFLVQSVYSQPGSSEIEAAFSKLENDPQLKYGIASLSVLNANTGQLIYSKNGHAGLAPASTLKTITSITAYNILGKDFTWETTLGYTGTLANGILNGDLILKGSGDPTLGSNRYAQSKAEVLLSRWTKAIENAGIKSVNGRLIADDSLFGSESTPMGWVWQDLGNYYGAGASALSWKENELGVRFQPGQRTGEPSKLLSSSTGNLQLKLVNEVLTGSPGSGDNVYAYSAPFSDLIYLRGTYGIDLEKTIMISMPDPALMVISDLKKTLEDKGITITGESTTARILAISSVKCPISSVRLDTYSSPDLGKAIYWLNQKSINLYAENILKTIAWKQGRQPGTENGVFELQKLWTGRLNIDKNALSILDGSGLSPENRITTSAMVSILQSAIGKPWYDSLFESLPSNNGMKIKSGSIRNVLAYAGYHKSSSGTPLVFTIVTNNYNGSSSAIRQKIFKVLDVLK